VSLPRDYAGQACSLARSLEIVGERWTLLIVRDAFYGVRRFGEFAAHLQIPRAVLAERLSSLTAAGVLARVAGKGRREEYELTEKGLSLWPVVWALIAWGDEFYAPAGPRRLFCHAADGGLIGQNGRCARCGTAAAVEDTVVAPGPGLESPSSDDDPVTAVLARPHRLLQPVHSLPPVASLPGR
jgi:DNA-binding HxlR family transcriptional regulator